LVTEGTSRSVAPVFVIAYLTMLPMPINTHTQTGGRYIFGGYH
jgi:hypothetical protein